MGIDDSARGCSTAETLAAGVPARPLRAITPADRVHGDWRDR